MKTVIQIVAEHLVANGFDGLFNGDAECGCLVADLEPCLGGMSQCEPGYKRDDPNGIDGDWLICRSKIAPSAKVGDMSPESLVETLAAAIGEAT